MTRRESQDLDRWLTKEPEWDFCPQCGSNDVTTSEYDLGIDIACGYHDQGIQLICNNCGWKGDI